MTQGNQHDDIHGGNRAMRAELDSLLTKLKEQNLKEPDRTRLGGLLSSSVDARWAYIHAVHLDEGIKKWSRTQGEADVWAVVDLLRESNNSQDRELATELEDLAVDDALVAHNSAESQLAGVARRRRDTKRHGAGHEGSWKRGAALAIVASLLVALALWQSGHLQGDALTAEGNISGGSGEALASNNATVNRVAYALSDSEHVVARVTSTTEDVSWARGQEPQDFLMRFRPGDVVGVEKGLIKIEFSAGALLVLESPAVLRVTSASSARLLEGRVVGRADNGNFTLLTPTASVVDIGTEFGVGISDGGTDVTVFEGEVHVHPLLESIDSASMQKLQQGMSARIDSSGLSNSTRQTDQHSFQRGFFRSAEANYDKTAVSLLDLISGDDTNQQRIAGSIDPKTGYWGRPPWFDPQRTKAQRGDTQFAQADWNPMVDGVFIPRSNAREMQIDSDGHMVHLPPNKGSTWGPIWARRRFDMAADQQALLSTAQQGYWGAGVLSEVLQRLEQTRDGMMGLHANVGITFDLDAVRNSRSRDLNYFKAVVANLDSSPQEGDSSGAGSIADLRVFVDGKLRYSRLQFGRNDGDAVINVALSNEDRFLTIVTTDAGSDPVFDHVVLIDPLLEYAPQPAPQPDQAASQPDQA